MARRDIDVMTRWARQTGATRGGRRVSYAALPEEPTWRLRLRDLARSQWLSLAIVAGAIVLLWLAWLVWTLPARSELARVERYLESLGELRDVSVSKPWFRRSLPETVKLTATGLPSGRFQYEVSVDLTGEYNTRTRVAHLKGQKQVLSPHEMLRLDWERPVPAR